jgi:hypothetical protein
MTKRPVNTIEMIETDDEQIIEETLQALAPRCNRSMVCEGRFYACTRYITHPGQCKEIFSGCWVTWWGWNEPSIEGTRNHVWKTKDWARHRLVTQDGPKTKTGVVYQNSKAFFEQVVKFNNTVYQEDETEE